MANLNFSKSYKTPQKSVVCHPEWVTGTTLLILRVTRVKVMGESSSGKYNWDALLKEYLVTNMTKTEFAASKGINPAYLRRFAKDWPNHKKVTDSKENVVTLPERLKPLKKTKAVCERIPEEKHNSVNTRSKDKEFDNPYSLDQREQAFCIFYSRNPNAGVCVIKAGYKCKNMGSAAAYGYQILQKSSVKSEIARLRRLRLASMAMTQDDLMGRIIEMHLAIGFGDMTETVDFGIVKIPLRDNSGQIVKLPDSKTGEMKIVYEEVNRLSVHDSLEVDGRIITKVSQTKEGGISITYADRQKSLDWLANYFGGNPMDEHKKEYDRKRLELEEKSMAQKGKTGALVAEAIASAGAQVQTLAGLLNNPGGNRSIEEFEK
jgi:phage terminase small subunit